MATTDPEVTLPVAESASPSRQHRSRPPLTLLAAAALNVALIAVTSFGAIYFALFDGHPALSLGRVLYVVAYLAINTAALAAVAGTLQGGRVAWRVSVSYVGYLIAFSAGKVVFFHEVEAVAFGVAAVPVAALLLAAPSRRHVR
jgi:hypothetical protein